MSYQSKNYPEHPIDSWWSDIIFYDFDDETISQMIGLNGENIKKLINDLYYNHGSHVNIHIQKDGILVSGTQYDVIRTIPLIWEAIPKSNNKTYYYRLDWNYSNDENTVPYISAQEIKTHVQRFLDKQRIHAQIGIEHDEYGVTFSYTHTDTSILNLIYNLIDFKVYQLISDYRQCMDVNQKTGTISTGSKPFK